jgi:DNA-binding NarL/FixJ family response regulator
MRRRIVGSLGELPAVTFADGQELLAAGSQRAPAAIVVDLPEGPATGAAVALLDLLGERFPSVPVVLVSDEANDRDTRRALAAGAVGVIGREQLEDTLGTCVQAVLAGQVCVPREQAGAICPPVLSTREKQILGLVVMGFMNSQIAGRLHLAESTVKSHLHSSFEKLGVRSRNEAVDVILDPRRGLGIGILGVGAQPLHLGGGA